jgi:hypothetical protein
MRPKDRRGKTGKSGRPSVAARMDWNRIKAASCYRDSGADTKDPSTGVQRFFITATRVDRNPSNRVRNVYPAGQTPGCPACVLRGSGYP